jgi:hypothetical protein
MTRTQILSSVAALALLATPAASLAANRGGGGHFGGGARVGGGPAMGARMGGYAGAAPAAGAAWRGGQAGWNNRSAWGGGGFWPGAAAGAAVGGLGSYAYYGGGPGDYGPGYADTYYDNGYYDTGATVAVVPGTTGADSSYCAQRFRSYDPASGTYLGYDGQRHSCP